MLDRIISRLGFLKLIWDFLKFLLEKIFKIINKNKMKDRKIFLASDKIINESMFESLFMHAYNLRLTQNDYDLLMNYKYYFNTPSDDKQILKIYKNKKIKASFDKFFDLFLKTFDGTEWSVSDRNDDFVLDQDLKRNNPDEYLKVMNKIKDLSNTGLDAYKEYRMTIKEILEI